MKVDVSRLAADGTHCTLIEINADIKTKEQIIIRRGEIYYCNKYTSVMNGACNNTIKEIVEGVKNLEMYGGKADNVNIFDRQEGLLYNIDLNA